MKPIPHVITAIHAYELMVIKIAIKSGCRNTLPKWFEVQTSLDSIVGRDVAMSYYPDSEPMSQLTGRQVAGIQKLRRANKIHTV